MGKWMKLFKALINAESEILPIFIHNPASQNIAGIILVAEQAVAGVLDNFVVPDVANAPVVAPAAPPATTSPTS